MTRLPSLVILLALAVPAAAQTPATNFSYTPPVAPPAIDPVGVLARLVGLTLVTLLVCGGVIWWARRANRAKLLAKADTRRLRLDGHLALDARNHLHVIRVDGQAVVVTTDASGLRSIVPLQERFENVLAEEASEEEAADPSPSPPAPLPPGGRGAEVTS